jgi:pimeloyl-ACP methyl ester carboxylesterase
MDNMVEIEPGIALHYTIDDYTDPWRKAETIVLVHGFCESGEAWRPWVPQLARRYRVVRADQRGFGRSTPMREDHAWSLDTLADDLAAVIKAAGGAPVHLIGAKIGATVSAHFAARHPQLLKTLTLIGLPVNGPKSRAEWIKLVHAQGVRAWARLTMEDRLGAGTPPAMLEAWSDLMGATPLSTMLGFMGAVGGFNVSADLPRIACPVLAMTSDSKLHPVAEAETWRKQIRQSELAVIPGDGFHAAAVYPDECARAALAFIAKHSTQEH